MPVLSLCIPTLNRSAYVCSAVRSIFETDWDVSRVELCISNNASEHDYSELEHLLTQAPYGLTVTYVVQRRRLTADEHMFALKTMARAEHLYFLGDDDVFLPGQLPQLIALVNRQAPDLAVFDGHLIDANTQTVGRHLGTPARNFTDPIVAFDVLRDKCMFGALLVRTSLLEDRYFKALFGTSHAYCCFWFSLLEKPSPTPVRILIPDFPLVGLRVAQKTYSALDVYYRQIPYEIAVYRRYLVPGPAQKANHRFERRYERMVASVGFLVQMRLAGMPISDLRDLAPQFHERHAWKVRLAEFLVRSGIYQMARGLSHRLRCLRPSRS
jgi:hypothetical protein